MEEYYDKPGVLINELIEEDQGDTSIIEEDLKVMNSTLQNLNEEMNLGSQGRQIADFIGAHPISLMKKHFVEILKNPDDWLVCEKTDGTRYLMLILNNGHVYLTGRNVGGIQQAVKSYQFFRINMSLPKLLCQQTNQTKVEEIFDGELIIDEFEDIQQTKKEFLHYLIFDTILHNGNQKVYINHQNSYKPFPYYERLRCAQEYLSLMETVKKLDPSKVQTDFQPLNFLPKIKIFLKDFFQIAQLKYLFNHYLLTLPHGNDGLIFTQNNAYYKPGTCEFIRKWKPPIKNTIDFLITPNKKFQIDDNDGVLELYLLDKQKSEAYLLFFDFVYTTKQIVDEIKQKIEFLYDQQQQTGDIQAIKGVIAECSLIKSQVIHQKLQKMSVPETFGKLPNQIDEYLTERLKYTEYFDNNTFQINDNYRSNQFYLLQQVREMVHLKDNFKSTWKIDRYRTDKTYPNNFRIGLNVLEILNENLTQNDLIDMMEPT